MLDKDKILSDMISATDVAALDTKPLITFDTFGTTVRINSKEFNLAFFDHAKELGYNAEDIAELWEKYQTKWNDPDYLKRSAKGKAEMVRRGIYDVPFFEDALDFFVEAASKGIKLITLSKGGMELVKAIYDRPLPEPITIGDRQYSTYHDFVGLYSTTDRSMFPEKTDPRCFLEFTLNMYSDRQRVLSYTTDDINEATAVLECSKRMRGMKNFQLNTGIFAILLPQEEHKVEGALEVRKQSGIYVVNSLRTIIDLSFSRKA